MLLSNRWLSVKSELHVLPECIMHDFHPTGGALINRITKFRRLHNARLSR